METKSKIKGIRGGKLLLKYLESLDWLERFDIRGLCAFAVHLLRYLIINDKQYDEIMKFIHENSPKTKYNEGYWFKPRDKQARIDYLKQVLYGNKECQAKD